MELQSGMRAYLCQVAVIIALCASSAVAQDVRNARWGMTPQEVASSETVARPARAGTIGDGIDYIIDYEGVEYELTYAYEDNKLVEVNMGKVFCDGSDILKALVAKYGRPTTTRSTRGVGQSVVLKEGITDATIIQHIVMRVPSPLFRDGCPGVSVTYQSKQYALAKRGAEEEANRKAAAKAKAERDAADKRSKENGGLF